MASADTLVLLSDIDGLYTGDPRRDPAATHLPQVEAVTPEIEAMAGAAGTGSASGGMATKLAAARIAALEGCGQFGRESGGGRGGQCGYSPVVARSLKQKIS